MSRKTLADQWENVTRKGNKLGSGDTPDEIRKSEVIYKIIWLEGVLSVLEILNSVESFNETAAAIWSVQREHDDLCRRLVEEAAKAFTPAELLAAAMRRPDHRNGGS